MSFDLEERVTNLEELMAELIRQNQKTSLAVQQLSQELREFKNEMREFKDEMLAFKDEMLAFKDEMLAFKDEMNAFKDRQEKENKRKNREWSDIARKLGTIVEDLIAPALRPVIRRYFECEPILEGQRIKRKNKGRVFEVDALVVCEKMVFLVEAKSTPRIDDIEDILKNSGRFFNFFPEYSDRKLVTIFGGIKFEKSVIRQATKKGIYVLAWREWEYMDILNFKKIQKRSIH